MKPQKIILSVWLLLVAALCSLAFVSATRGENHALLSTTHQLRLLKKIGGGSSSSGTSSNSNSGSSNNEGKSNSEIIYDAYVDYAEAERKNNLRIGNQNNETRDSSEDSEDEGSGGLWPLAVAVFVVFVAAPCLYQCLVRCRRHKNRKESVLKRKLHDALRSLEDETFQQAAKPSRPAAAPLRTIAQLTTTSTTETSGASEGAEIADPEQSWVAVFAEQKEEKDPR